MQNRDTTIHKRVETLEQRIQEKAAAAAGAVNTSAENEEEPDDDDADALAELAITLPPIGANYYPRAAADDCAA